MLKILIVSEVEKLIEEKFGGWIDIIISYILNFIVVVVIIIVFLLLVCFVGLMFRKLLCCLLEFL